MSLRSICAGLALVLAAIEPVFGELSLTLDAGGMHVISGGPSTGV